jgi:RNA polymerase sigma factor (sigma-70 family)
MKAGKSYSDGELIEAISRRESLERPVRYLYELHFDNLTHFIKKNKGSQQDAEDLFQELILVFIDLVQTGKFRGQSSIKTFLYAIARNLWLNELKKRERFFCATPSTTRSARRKKKPSRRAWSKMSPRSRY